MAALFNAAAMTLLATIWRCGLLAQAGGQRRALLPESPAPDITSPPPPPTAPASAPVPPGSVRWGMPLQGVFPRTLCPDGSGRPWIVLGRDAELIRTLAAYTNQLDGCVQVMYYNDPYDNITNGQFHVYGEGMYWAPQMVDRVRYLYPHIIEPLCFMIRRADFVKREIYDAFSPGVYILIGLYLVIFIVILCFGFKLDVTQAVTEATETFFTGGFVDSRRPLMIWGSIFSLIVLNSFSGVFTSFLTVPKRGYEVETLEEVTQHYDFAHAAPDLRQAFLSHVDRSDNPKLFALFESKKPIKELIGFRYPSLEIEINYKHTRLIYSKYYELRQIKECMWSAAFVSFAVAKNWTLAGHYDRLLMILGQAGVVFKTRDDEWRNYSFYFKQFYETQSSRNLPQLSLGHTVDAFVILGVGTGAALASFLAELSSTLWTKFNACFMIPNTK